MNTNGIVERHWLYVSLHFTLDALFFAVSFVGGCWLRFGHSWEEAFSTYWPSISIGAVIFPVVAYICGLYSKENFQQSSTRRALLLFLCFAISSLGMLFFFYANFSTRVGRGVMFLSGILSLASVGAHHFLLLSRSRRYQERVAVVVACPEDEAELSLLGMFGREHMEVVGVITHRGYTVTGPGKVLGTALELSTLAASENLHRIVCSSRIINDTSLCGVFCRLRYSGVTVMPLISLCEEVYHCVPIELVTPEWLMNASASPHIVYIKKLKRGFDIIASLVGLVVLSPFLALGMLLVKANSPGPMIYRQTRVGRFGKNFQVLKLRTMPVNAEKDGPVWSSGSDSRVSPIGKFLRKYRIDEVPQLINVLRGEMSLVGPRPERPEFVEMLAKEIPHYMERLMVQPGLTGWAQVNFPYGSSLEDTVRKLEYDLYYAKHMSLFLDVFSLLDTIRIVVRGGVGQNGEQKHTARRAVLKDFSSRRAHRAADELANSVRATQQGMNHESAPAYS